jgi:hypothetical protein
VLEGGAGPETCCVDDERLSLDIDRRTLSPDDVTSPLFARHFAFDARTTRKARIIFSRTQCWASADSGSPPLVQTMHRRTLLEQRAPVTH